MRELEFSIAGFLLYLLASHFLPSYGQSLSNVSALNASGVPSVSSVSNIPQDTLNNITDALVAKLESEYGFCILDANAEKNLLFDIPTETSLLNECFQGQEFSRVCTPTEIIIYFKYLTSNTGIPPNKNCNASSYWPRGCEPGWASAANNENISYSQDVSGSILDIPQQDRSPKPCCDGFFCPEGLSCMIPCPLGSYCHVSELNNSTGKCEPYKYQLTANVTDLTCGGADKWADIVSTPHIFCNKGFYCPTPVKSISCKTGHYCREGSTVQSKCRGFTSCPSEAERQDLKIYGILFIVALFTAMFLMYVFSGIVSNIQERHMFKIRKNAAQQAKEHVAAFGAWQKAKEAQKFAKSISRRILSHRRAKSEEELKILVKDDSLRLNPSLELAPCQENIESSIRDEDLYPVDYSHSASNSVSARRLAPTTSQIFKYAYREIEKERSRHSQTSCSSGTLNGHMRPCLELAFIDLSLKLKKNGKSLLSNVTGRLSSGRIAAIMGPSGAGKTTFLNAVAGKAFQCKSSGHIYINGKRGSIQAYRKNIGFVPQDDILHGNLTVEENIWFSARYRLPTDMEKSEKVLIVERIIAILGLDQVRNMYVGTVERRGISGGQRKRVNVALELAMEPSLLILDEPTTGLDSTSSQLVLQALRREASAGANVILVLHQPSYTLFKMFDDLMLLGKGGCTVYLGPVNEVEHYFENLGFIVPEFINPPDYFMDILEGVVGHDYDPKVLPVYWMQYKGYKVPKEMEAMAMEYPFSQEEPHLDRRMEKSKTFTQEAWEEVKGPFVIWWEAFQSTISTGDETGRKTPTFFRQFFIILKRVLKQRFREARLTLQDYMIIWLVGAFLGLMSEGKDSNLWAKGYTNSIIALPLLCMIAALRTFSADKLQFWRESASGMNRIAYFFAKDMVDHFNTVAKPLVYLSMFFFLNEPRSTYLSNFIVTLALVYCVTGIAYIFAITLEHSTAQLMAVLFPVAAALIGSKTNAKGNLKYLVDLSYVKWAHQAYVIMNAKRYSGVWLISRCGLLLQVGYDIRHFNKCIGILIAYGIVARIVALLCLFLANRNRQK